MTNSICKVDLFNPILGFNAMEKYTLSNNHYRMNYCQRLNGTMIMTSNVSWRLGLIKEQTGREARGLTANPFVGKTTKEKWEKKRAKVETKARGNSEKTRGKGKVGKATWQQK